MIDIAAATCPTCAEPGKLICPHCDSVAYCLPECRHADLPAHHPLCETFKNFQERPQCKTEHACSTTEHRMLFDPSERFEEGQPDMVRGIYFPVDEKDPRWVWLPAKLCNDKSEDGLKEYVGKNADDKLKLDREFRFAVDCVARKKLPHQVRILWNHACNFDESPWNTSVLHFTAGRYGFQWLAPIVAFAA